MISKISFRCSKCGKKFVINGHWYNQCVIEWWRDARFTFHCVIFHRHRLSWKEMQHMLKIIAFFPLFLILQMLDIIVEPFRHL